MGKFPKYFNIYFHTYSSSHFLLIKSFWIYTMELKRTYAEIPLYTEKVL